MNDDYIRGFSGFTIFGPGIRFDTRGPVVLDTGYDIQADAFLFGRVDLTALSNGTVEIRIGPRDGDPGNIVGGGTEPLDALFAELKVNVVSDLDYDRSHRAKRLDTTDLETILENRLSADDSDPQP